jgi:TRAP-type C4-dicarboxylate transport system permease small subunit
LEKKESYEVNYWVRERGSLMKVIIKRIASLFNSIGFVLGVTLMILMIFTLSAAVCARYVWSIFIGAALGFRKGSPIDHIRMDFFVSFLPVRLRKITDKVVWGVTVFFCLTILVLGMKFFILTISILTSALEISQGYIYISLPIFAIISLGFLFDLLTHSNT